MAVELTDTYANFVGTGASAVYAAEIYANSSDQIDVTVDGALQTIGDDYALNGVGSPAGISITATFPLNAAVLVERVTPITQLVDTQNNETILEDVLDAEFDKVTLICQELDGKANRAVLFPRGELGIVLPAPVDRASKFLQFDNLGNLIVGAGTIDPNAITFDVNGGGSYAVSRSLLASLLSADPRFLGYVGDGNSHPLSSVLLCQGQITAGWSLARWQTIFPRALALTDEIDRHAIQRMCDIATKNVRIKIPAGRAIIDKGIVTGDNQSVNLTGEGGDLSVIEFRQTNGTLWTHGYTGHLANGRWYVSDLTVQTNTIANAAFDVHFSGNQTPFCHIMRNVLIQPITTGQYFINACITRNIKRGLDWQNVVAYGAYFAILSTDAFLFPANTDNTAAGNSYNFNNCMTVGYRYGVNFDFTGFTSATSHCHEEAQFYNFQSYAGVGLFRAIDGNYNTAPDDNWTFIACGWQGTGPAFECAYLEMMFISNCLLVNDVATGASVMCGHFLDCDDVNISRNEIFCISGTQITAWSIEGAHTRNIVMERNNLVAYASLTNYLLIAANVPAGGVKEHHTTYAGGATFTAGMVQDFSALQTSQMRVQALAAVQSVTAYTSYETNILSNGKTEFIARYTLPTGDAFGNISITFPFALFRQAPIVTVHGIDASKTTIPFHSNPGNSGGVVVRCASNGVSPATGTSVSFEIRAIGV